KNSCPTTKIKDPLAGQIQLINGFNHHLGSRMVSCTKRHSRLNEDIIFKTSFLLMKWSTDDCQTTYSYRLKILFPGLIPVGIFNSLLGKTPLMILTNRFHLNCILFSP